MTISKDLLLSILAMDTYNREYGSGIDVEGNSVGYASIVDRTILGIGEPQYQAWQAAGVYGVAYEIMQGEQIDGMVMGETVISYRGTGDLAWELLPVDFPISVGDYDEQQVYLAA